MQHLMDYAVDVNDSPSKGTQFSGDGGADRNLDQIPKPAQETYGVRSPKLFL